MSRVFGRLWAALTPFQPETIRPGVVQREFRIELDGDSNHRKIMTTLGPFKSADTQHTVESKRLKRVKRYFWRVVVTDARGNEGESEWQVFKTGRLYGKKKRKTATRTKKPKRPVKGGRYGKITASRLNMRSGPSTKNEIVRVLRVATQVRILGEKGAWLEVEISDQDGRPLRGYVSKKYVKE